MKQFEILDCKLEINKYLAYIQYDELDGAISTFIGSVRAYTKQGAAIESLVLDHYQELAEATMAKRIKQARAKWNLNKVLIRHRTGTLYKNEQIVFVGVTAPHRRETMLGCSFLMDFLKAEASFWKKEYYKQDGNLEYQWLENNEDLEQLTDYWQVETFA